MKQLTESLFDKDLTIKNLSPAEIANLYKGYKLNKTDGTKDCFGTLLKKGDLVLVYRNASGMSIGVYNGLYKENRGRLCEILIPDSDLTRSHACYCDSVFKLTNIPEIK